MTPEAWGVNLGAIGAAAWGGWQAYRARGSVDDVKRRQTEQVGPQLDRLEVLAGPTGNGFAATVLAKLEGLERGQLDQTVRLANVEAKLDRHIGDHAAAEVRSHGRSS